MWLYVVSVGIISYSTKFEVVLVQVLQEVAAKKRFNMQGLYSGECPHERNQVGS